ncbi:putative permease, cadmium resistance protein [Cylindrospermum stagnale PCC 7417]|uniref:Putative permease, cadmium resistance protein n=1 Tax=Cylindrospermum stagnale PCC 7417 TaxID=56107 RepID=K9WYK1_9NOST|nr:cadmium resistance transporter [Cylindrospermum stagnale]AFZ24904.1 putative permease, cadmium resistance protein [Cylindrospermum stagnale PCC 7417]
MNNFITAISTGLVAFCATNIDDIVILLLFFSQVNANFRPRHIIAGQYLGFTILVILSLPGFFGGLILPPKLIGLLGLIPITIGISSLVNREVESPAEVAVETELAEASTIASLLTPQTYSVAAMTVANGSDNVSIYVPLFASSSLGNLLIIIIIFFILLAIWCYAAYQLTNQNQKIIANILTRCGNYSVPFVLIGLGAFIIWQSEALSPIKLVASCICLMVLVKNNEITS